MLPIKKEAANFVRACEEIHSLLAHGGALTPDERALIDFSGRELLRKVTPVSSDTLVSHSSIRLTA